MRPLIRAVTRRTILTAVLVFALAASVAAAPQRGGGGRFGGGHFGGGHFGGGHFSGPHGRIFIGGGFYDPFWGPYYPYAYGYGYPYYGPFDYSLGSTGSVKTDITPKQAGVYVDGYYAGVADDFDGAIHRLHTSLGGHAVTFYLEGYRTLTENIYVRPNSTVKLTEGLQKLAPGEVSEPVPQPAAPTGRSDR